MLFPGISSHIFKNVSHSLFGTAYSFGLFRFAVINVSRGQRHSNLQLCVVLKHSVDFDSIAVDGHPLFTNIM